MTTLMKCGHAANGTRDGEPVCVICLGIDPGAELADATPSLEGRVARCTCGKERPSSLDLAFFAYRGPGGHGTRRCGAVVTRGGWTYRCGLMEVGHQPGRAGADHVYVDEDFSSEVDSYYCGCRGWD